MDAKVPHNTVAMLVDFYGLLLTEKERENQLLRVEIVRLQQLLAKPKDEPK